MSSPSGENRTGGRGGRPRDTTVDQRILHATTSLLAQKGFRGLRVDDVARSAGVPKSTIYRRWPSLTDLAVAAVDDALGDRETVISDDPLDDLAQIVVRTHTLLISSPLAGSLPQLALDLVNRPETARLYRERVISPLRDAAIDAVQRAIEQASWEGPDAEMSVDMMIGTGLYRHNYLGHVPTLEEAFAIADTVAGRQLPRPDSSPKRQR
ncbi:TetR/AcrR family transcriptional regulator [Actinomyces naeslundii]|uniref:TetR/AcrR family transcriptional regulator n=1 Tax=Actinomyces naeslundii TaxID=1655 RepID=UPI00094C6985|nr:TetR/AcrR family transcriptional regulator [Actinomyces naeslundii]OLO89012.1 TetR family transcriptional regulator [Actinomyces naeslundii]OMG09646.1 TetR family transcriptional regulator [Actinomyces naeslundii]